MQLGSVVPRHGLGPVLRRFAPRAGMIRELALRDRGFRDLCEDLALALNTLATFESRGRPSRNAEIVEYRSIVRELEGEVAARLDPRNPRRAPVSPWPQETAPEVEGATPPSRTDEPRGGSVAT